MPPNVIRFEQLMYLNIGISIVVAALQYQSLSIEEGPAVSLFIVAFDIGLRILFIWLIARRHASWARWVLLIMGLYNAVRSIPDLSQVLQTNPLPGILVIIQDFMVGIALYLVFTGNAVAWFKKLPPPMPEK